MEQLSELAKYKLSQMKLEEDYEISIHHRAFEETVGAMNELTKVRCVRLVTPSGPELMAWGLTSIGERAKEQ